MGRGNSYKNFVPSGAVEANISKLNAGGLRPDEMRRTLGALRKCRLPDAVLARFLTAAPGIQFVPASGRLQVIEESPVKVAGPVSLSEKARLAAGRILEKTTAPQFELALLRTVPPAFAPAPLKVTTGRIRQAHSQADWRSVAELVARTPALRQTVVNLTSFSGDIDRFRQSQPNDDQIRTAGTIMTAGAWDWEESARTEEANWFGIKLADEVVPVVRRSALLGTVHRSRVELHVHGTQRPRPAHYNHMLRLRTDEWFVSDPLLADMFAVEPAELERLPRGLPLKPDAVTELDEYIAARDSTLAPVQSLLLAQQHWQPVSLRVA